MGGMLATGNVVYDSTKPDAVYFKLPFPLFSVHRKPSEAGPVVLMLGGSEAEQDMAGRSQEKFTELNGIAYGQPGETFDAPFCASALVEYGLGSMMRSVVMDWKVGSYNLPPLTYLRVSLLELNFLAYDRYYMAASAVDGTYQTGDVPTYTMQGYDLAAYPAFGIPSGARAVELLSYGTLELGSVKEGTFKPLQTVKRFDDGTLDPPWSPVRIDAASVHSHAQPSAWRITRDSGDTDHVRFLLSL